VSRQATGSLYQSRGVWFVVLTIQGKRVHFRLGSSKTREQAVARQAVVADVAKRLRGARKEAVAEGLCRLVADSDERTLQAVMTLVDSTVAGVEKKAPDHQPLATNGLSLGAAVTVRELAKLWTSGELAQKFRSHVADIDQSDNKARLKKHVFPVVYQGRKIGDLPVSDFTLDHADFILGRATLPAGSVRHVAQILHRVFALAVYPVRLIKQSPLPRGWLPKAKRPPEFSYLFPSEEVQLLGYTEVPLVFRVLMGFMAREGLRRATAQGLEWSHLVLDRPDRSGICSVSKNKNGMAQTWVLDPGTSEALRRWQKICPSTKYVFTNRALKNPQGDKDRPVNVQHLAGDLRRWLELAGVKRPMLYARTDNQVPLRAHDLRATFVTLSLALDKSEAWVMQRTGHMSSVMLNRYRRAARTAEELTLGWLLPMHEVIPELAKMGKNTDQPFESSVESSADPIGGDSPHDPER